MYGRVRGSDDGARLKNPFFFLQNLPFPSIVFSPYSAGSTLLPCDGLGRPTSTNGGSTENFGKF